MSKFLTFDNFHLAPVEGIDPKSLKRAAKLARTIYLDDERKLPHNLALNHIAHRLGFKGGFGGYVAEWKGKLPTFMRGHGLAFRKDVLPTNLPDQRVRLGHRQIADRLFASGLPMPKRIFTGLDVFVLLRAAAATDGLKVGYRGMYGANLRDIPFDEIKPAEIRENVPPDNYFIRSETDLMCAGDTHTLDNLIGDQLCDLGEDGRIVAQLYNLGDGDAERIESAGRLFRRVLELCPQGWVEVIPYNDRLAFLKGPDGGYDFVFEGVRDAEFKRNPYAPYLRDKDFSKTEEASELDVRLYFSHDGWLEADWHAAEESFYAHGGTHLNYPGRDEILKAHLTRQGRYSHTPRKSPFRPGYTVATVLGKDLCFSPLVPVRRFHRFLRDNPDYLAHRLSLSDLEPLDLAGDPDDPAAVTWYDAKAYARWIKRTQKLPVRLPTEDEWLALAGGLVPDKVSMTELKEAFSKRLYDFVAADGHVFDGHPPHMGREDFDSLTLRRNPANMAMERSEAGMEVVRSAWFGEWLQAEGAAINGLFGCSQYEVGYVAEARVSAERARFSPRSAGKYKSMMIGFRLVYEAEVRK
ncbi:SUMF1/EgtB/PvdO family nonheme iron enzyme [Magnetospirillum sp. 15-1]|uniref:SUMF1/EgtB/PvdO family nonheme iron enzyme n=1 Tax=Magnetospirillum sp. 15-1 TaxID=1979370 RepID=UPI000BBBE40C|nr:SUMF1/EgtB/PvdO family nonheme iron enzyme [Magnetospirillum sp. 15-1]